MEEKNTSRNFLITQMGIVLLGWILVLISWTKLPPQIPWFYSLPWGEDQLMRKTGLIWILGAVTVLSLLTSKLPDWTKKNDRIILNSVLVTLILMAILLILNLLRVLAIFIL